MDLSLEIIPLSLLKPNKEQPRKTFDEGEIDLLAKSINQKGILQPLLVEKIDNNYMIIDGERRYRAALRTKTKDVPCIVQNAKDDALERSLISNLQRENLSPVEEAMAYDEMIKRGYNEEGIAKVLGLRHKRIRSRLYIVKLDEEIRQMIHEGKLPYGAGVLLELLAISSREARLKRAMEISENGRGGNHKPIDKVDKHPRERSEHDLSKSKTRHAISVLLRQGYEIIGTSKEQIEEIDSVRQTIKRVKKNKVWSN